MDMQTQPKSDPRQNKLLAALPADVWLRWSLQLEVVDLTLGQVLLEPGRTPEYVYFPTTAIVSILYMTQDGESTEIAVIGNDGVVGMPLFMGGESSPNWSVVQSAGQCYRLRGQAIKSEVERAGVVLMMLLQYTQAMMWQVGQTAVCNRFQSIDQLLCRRLLLSLDRLQSDAINMTQELMANLLGVRREGVTAAALRLQQAGVIRYSRGKIVVLDRAQLEQRTGESMVTGRYAPAQEQPMRLAA